VLGVGVMLRRVSLPASLFLLGALILAGSMPAEPGLEPSWVLGAPLLLMVMVRTVAVGLGAVGWLVFPASHRALLSEIVSEARVNS
jgi:hypothetical protein